MIWYYLIEAGFIHLLLYLGYYVLLRKQTDYRFMRAYLLGATALSLLIPLVDIPILSAGSTFARAQEVLLQPVIITDGEAGLATAATHSWQFSWQWVPLAITILLASSLALGLLQIVWAFLRSHKMEAFGISVRVLKDEDKSFTFLKYIFSPSQPEEAVLHHEKGHADLLHSLDILLVHTYRILFWWTPSTWWTLKELRLLHEYQADAKALENTSIEEYKNTLISRTLSSMNLSLASSFHHGALFKRLEAMQAKRESIKKWRTGILGILVASTVIVFSCTDSEIQEIAKDAKVSISYPASVQERLDEIQNLFPEREYKVIELKHEGLGDANHDSKTKEKQALDAVQKIIPTSQVRYVENSGDRLYAIVENSKELQQFGEAIKSEDGVYTIAEEQPEFEGGIEEFYGFIAGHMTYPKQARQMGIQGKVYVRFVVNEDGTVSDATVVKGIGAGCDAEAARVVAQSTGWTPGKVDGEPVKVRMMVPIMFRLSGEPAKEEGPPPTLN